MTGAILIDDSLSVEQLFSEGAKLGRATLDSANLVSDRGVELVVQSNYLCLKSVKPIENVTIKQRHPDRVSSRKRFLTLACAAHKRRQSRAWKAGARVTYKLRRLENLIGLRRAVFQLSGTHQAHGPGR